MIENFEEFTEDNKKVIPFLTQTNLKVLISEPVNAW